ncbi:hypothetical protein CHT23_004660 [Salmonella enterica subsp. houtenae serovar 48:z4,z32:-]|uniref:Uncharacterized protein n=1 Tax=Salmonella enterica TaxID=28901 RepID=A0A3I6S1Q9_SALER|nr:hypothetical protein [Salmonella enterica]EBY3697862.1 hypothetical protein [Salmonella enterica subsp. enterica serovar Muenchen]ECE0917735.1 hypothetical protein [Salmonella enterica subsp. enterica]EDR9394352.1 hypothetical protein [Salmonella enterica subsp. enterica serovar Baildon]EEE1666996.1 hypothetical protein [Salmonella enterica subsp. houtenae serovar 48:z4,z32:-]
MKITQWLISLIHTEQREIPDMKDIVTDNMVKNDPRSDTVTTAVKVQIKSTLDQQIDTALVDLLGAEQGRQERDQ